MPEIGIIRLDDKPVDGELEKGPTSNWAYDHAHDNDAHDLVNLILNLSADTAPSSDDLILTVNDPAGTPANRKVTVGNFFRNLPDGSSGAPSLAFASELTLGFYRPGAGKLSIMGGQVGIGTTPGYTLDVNGDIGVRNTFNLVGNAAEAFIQASGIAHMRLNVDSAVADTHFRFTRGGTELVRIDSSGNVGIGTTDQFGDGAKVIGIVNAATVPTSNPTGGGVLYCEAGALKYRGSSGTITTIAPA
jgi:hypothetical protein